MLPIIEVENISKQYRLGTIGTGTVSHDLNRWWHQIRGKEDPYLKIGQANDKAIKSSNEYVWSLKDISFNVNAGEVLGIIGKNGAGKSTLLKILSRVTAPTTGNIKMRGRVASLLEVGTGFHPELTGRENVFLNGAILGMTKAEIKSKFDEIVDFSGVEKYIDTPVKRYSSGMYVRLAFAVAAHLEPEILIVDEVLAVGDAEFQKRCLGKMKDVSANDGRTVLFVSHNMLAIKSMCDKVILLSGGKFQCQGSPNEVINKYLQNDIYKNISKVVDSTILKQDKLGIAYFKSIELFNQHSQTPEVLMTSDRISFRIILEVVEKFYGYLQIALKFGDGSVLFYACSPQQNFNLGTYTIVTSTPENLLNTGYYNFDIDLIQDSDMFLIRLSDIFGFNIEDNGRTIEWYGSWPGYIRPQLEWEIDNAYHSN